MYDTQGQNLWILFGGVATTALQILPNAWPKMEEPGNYP